MQDLAGKVAVVTGGGGGIGRALGERFLAEGMRVVLADIDEPLLDATVAELGARHDDVVGVVTDVSLPDSVEQLRDATLERFGSVHLVCNNAGIPSGSDGALWQHHVNDWRWAVDVNVFGVINGINTFVPVLLEQGGPGHVVNTSSSNGTFAPLSNSAVYATTKAAVTTITECLWGQMRSADLPVQVSLLLPSTRTPGALDTGIWRPGRNRPERYARPGQAPVEGRDALTPFVEQLERHGQELDVRTTRGGGRHRARRDPGRPVLDLPPGREVGRDRSTPAPRRCATPPRPSTSSRRRRGTSRRRERVGRARVPGPDARQLLLGMRRRQPRRPPPQESVGGRRVGRHLAAAPRARGRAPPLLERGHHRHPPRLPRCLHHDPRAYAARAAAPSARRRRSGAPPRR